MYVLEFGEKKIQLENVVKLNALLTWCTLLNTFLLMVGVANLA